jgi:hypothetical protein
MNLLLAVIAFASFTESPIRFDKPIDRRPFLIRLICSIGFAFEVGAEKARLKVDSRGAEAETSTDKDSLTVRELLPTGGAVTVKFGTDF